jgi:NlpC/P60 family putative phage cell wall peptidase
VRGIYRKLYGAEPTLIPPYSPDWAEQCGEETLLNAAQDWLCEIPNKQAQPGDVLLFRMAAQSPCKHIAVLTAPTVITHAYWGRAVVESHLVPYWKNRLAYSFAFPETSKVLS